MKLGKSTLLILTAVFLLTEIIFNFSFLGQRNDELFGGNVKTIILLLLIFLFSKRVLWAKLTLSVLLALYGIFLILAGHATEFSTLYLIGLYDIFFAVCVYTTKTLHVVQTVADASPSMIGDKVEIGLAEETRDNVQKYTYPLLVNRYKALLIDGLLLLTVLIVIMAITPDNENRTTIMVSSGLILLLTYEPFLTAYSKTIGQRVMKIRVGNQNNPHERISLLNAYIRWFVKGLLGGFHSSQLISTPHIGPFMI